MNIDPEASFEGHRPVMLDETMEWLNIESERWYIDANLGGGGHAREILNRGGKVLAIDRDQRAVTEFRDAAETLYPGRFIAILGNNADLGEIAGKEGITPSGILFDLGWSSIQGEDPERGLSFSEEGPLDMRLDIREDDRAEDFLERFSEEEFVDLFSEVDEPLARPIARALVQARRQGRLPRTTLKLASFVSGVYYRKGFRRSRRHPATRVFMALRIRVNKEYENLARALAGSLDLLKDRGGRLLVLTFHSGEDRIVKRTFREWTQSGSAEYLFRKSLQPDREEIRRNPRARSARLRGVRFGRE